jgi:hypothetical protein
MNVEGRLHADAWRARADGLSAVRQRDDVAVGFTCSLAAAVSAARGSSPNPTVNEGTSDRFRCCGHKVRICEDTGGKPMFFQTVSPLFAVGEVLLGLSLTMFVGALITTVSENARSRRR